MPESDNSPSYANAFVNEESSGNPAWESLLGEVPEEYHQALTTHLQSWDKGVNEKFSKIHEDYKPYKELGDPQQLQFAMNIMNQLENDPLEIYRPLHNYLTEQGVLETFQGQEDDEDEDDSAPWMGDVNELKSGFSTIAQAWLADQEAKEEALQDALLEEELTGLRSTYGDFDEEFVLAKAYTGGMELEDAVKAWQAKENEILTRRNRPQAPRVLGSAGAFPGQAQIDVSKLTERGRRDYIADRLKDMNDQS